MIFLAALHEFQKKVVHLSSSDNRLADHLNRLDTDQKHRDQFIELTKDFVLEECVVSSHLFQNYW